MNFIRINTPGSTHLYDVYVVKDGQHGVVEVEATNRNQAARLAIKAGYTVSSVNMIG